MIPKFRVWDEDNHKMSYSDYYNVVVLSDKVYLRETLRKHQKVRLSWEIDRKTAEVVGDYKTLKAAYDSIKVHVKDRDKFAGPCYCVWQKRNVVTVDYGKHNAFYKIEER